MLLLVVPPVKSFLTCPAERLQGPGSLHPALEGLVRKSVGEGVLEEPCPVGYDPREIKAVGTNTGLQGVWA